MNVFPLTTEERAQGGFTHRIELTHADLTQTAANTAQVISLITLAIGMMVLRVATRMTIAFQDVSDNAFNSTAITIGDTGTANLFLASQELNVNGTEVYNKAGTMTAKAYDSTDALNITFNSMSAKSLSNIDVGAITVFAEIVDLKQLAGS